MSLIDEKVDAKAVINAFMRGKWTDDFWLPNYTPMGWWECDVFQLRKSGRWIEHEVKLTISDFRADAKKETQPPAWRAGGSGAPIPAESKHGALAGAARGPNHFYFITPWGMVQPSGVPAWAGLIQFQMVKSVGPASRNGFEIYFSVLKEAPLRHQLKIDDKVREHALGVCYWRYHRARQQNPT